MEISDTHGDIDEDMPVKEREEDKNSDLRMAMIKNLPLRVSVLLGKTKMPLGEILQLSPGYVVELDRFENEPVDILINDRIIAKGEVILVDDQFGVRILKILGPGEEGLLRNQPV